MSETKDNKTEVIGKVVGTLRITAKMRAEYERFEWQELPEPNGGSIIHLVGYKRATPAPDPDATA